MSDFDEFLEEVGEEEASDTIRNKISLLVNRHQELLSESSDLKVQQAQIAKEIVEIEQRKIPDALLEAGLSEIKTLDGIKVSTKPFVGAIPSDMKESAFSWMDSNGFGDIIKRSVTVEFSKGQEEQSKAAEKILRDQGLDPHEKRDVHYQTFSSWTKEQLAKGVSIPLDRWGVYHGQKASIKRS